MAKLFFSYSHADEALRDQLEKQLSMLRRQGLIEVWHDRRINAGQEFAGEIDKHLDAADVVLLLVSPDFLASPYCYEIEMTRALERHEKGEAIVIPVILRACLWHDAPFGKLLGAPTDGRPVTQWPDRDQAFLEVAKAIKSAVEAFAAPPGRLEIKSHPATPPAAVLSAPRSSNLRLGKTFSDLDKDRFKHQAFAFMMKFFENSLSELETRNQGIQGTFREIDANRFTASIYKSGKKAASCTVFTGGGHFGGGIAYVASETSESNTINESLSVEADDQQLYLRSMGMAHMGQADARAKLSEEGAAELYWSLLIERLR